MKFIKIFTGIFLAFIIFLLGFIKSELKSCLEISMYLFIIFLNGVILFVCKEYDKKASEVEKKDEKITNLNDKISVALLGANGNSPYKIQVYIEGSNNNAISIKKEYVLVVLVSTINSDYDIKYINLDFNEKVAIKQNGVNAINSDYNLKKTIPNKRNGKYEYEFESKNRARLFSIGRCEFTLFSEKKINVKVDIEVCGENQAVAKKESIDIKIVD